MGYTGRILVARSDRLAELASAGGVEVLHESTYADGWRSAQLDGDLPDATRVLVAETGAPALSAFILDSDVADVEASTPSGVSWHVYLHPAQAEGYGAPALEQTTDQAIGQALVWSAEAGLTVGREALPAVLAKNGVFAEETLTELLVALGIGTLAAEDARPA